MASTDDLLGSFGDKEYRELMAEVAHRFSEENIEDWDFRDPDVEFNDPVAGFFLIQHYPTIMAVDLARLGYIKEFLESGLGQTTDDKRHIVLPGASDDFWRGFTKVSFREKLTEEGRLAIRVRKSLEREWRKYGKLKVGVLPPPGAKSALSKSPPDVTSDVVEFEGPRAAPPIAQGRYEGRTYSDLGVSVVDAIAVMMGVDEDWCTRDERGFTWWGKDYAQRVWSEPGFDDDGFEIFRLHARTQMIRGFEPTDENLAKLNALSMVASTSGFVVDPDEKTVDLAASMYVHEETADWVKRCFGAVVAIQATDAQLKAELLARATGAKPATSAHPVSGPRPELDNMLNILEQVVVPRGHAPSAWEGDQMLAIVEAVQSAGNTVMATGGETGLTAELPFQSETSLLTVRTRERHPQLGYGVLIRLQLPVLFPESDGIQFAGELNRRELVSLTRAHFLGTWCWHDEFLQFVTFLPNVLNLGDGDLFNFLASSYGRAKWVAETIYGDDWSENRDASGRPLAKPAITQIIGDEPANDTSVGVEPEEGDDDEWPSPLNAELFARGTDAYANVSLDIVMQAGEGGLPPVSQFATERALFLVERTTKGDVVRKYWDSFLEAFGVAFRLTWAEEWEDLDPDHAVGLIDDGLRQLRAEHIRNGVADPIDLSDREQRAIFSVMGLVGAHPTFQRVREYLFSRAAYRRLETLDDLHLKMGVAAGEVARRDTDAFWSAQLVAWKTGQAFALLDLLGELDERPDAQQAPSGHPYSEAVLEGLRLAAAHDVDLLDLASSVRAEISQAHADSTTGRVWFPAKVIRGLCAMDFLVAADISDPRLDGAISRSSSVASDDSMIQVFEICEQLVEERGLAPVIDALIELIRDPDAPPASGLL